MRIDKNTTIRLGNRNIVKVKLGDVVIWQKTTEPVVGPDYFYIENVDTSDGEITFTTTKRYTPTSGKYAEKIEYSSDKANWNTINFNTTTPQTVTIKSGEKVYLRNDSGFFNFILYNGYEYTTTINTTKKCVVGGNLNSLLDYNNLDNIDISKKESCFSKLFYNATNIIDASILIIPSTTLASSCYKSMFYGCSSLTSAPTLPATTLADSCYSSMFQGCTSLTTAPELPSTTLANGCYSSMFSGCTSLTTAPELPSTTLANGCYYEMFRGCNSLTTAPTLPSTTLASSCYYSMFNGCTSLTTAPELPATTLIEQCYGYMFSYCSKLTTAPELPATTLASDCYREMFNGCTSLVNAPTELPATTLKYQCYRGMFSGCKSLVTAPIISATTLADYCCTAMFSECTSLVNAPTELPATTLASDCYYSMFRGCSKLTTAPELPATTLTYECYREMFGGCTSLNEVTVYTQDISASGCTNNWLSGVASSGTFNNMGFAPFKTGSSGIPNGWTEVTPEIQSITANPDTFTIKSYKDTVKCTSTLTITTTTGKTVTDTNSATITVGENTGDTTRTLTETIPYKGSSYQVTIVQTANDVRPPQSWNVVSTGTYPFELNTNDYYESTNKGKSNSYSYATLNYEGFENLVLECINYGESNYDYGIISQPDVQLSESTKNDGETGSAKVFKNFSGQSSANPVQLTIPSDEGSHFITIKYKKDGSGDNGNDSLQFKVIEP